MGVQIVVIIILLYIYIYIYIYSERLIPNELNIIGIKLKKLIYDRTKTKYIIL